MNRRSFLKTAGIATLGFSLSGLGCTRADGTDQPNIILIMADDMGYSDIGCYGSEIPTPNIDQLAQGGMRFSNFYNAARCCPTRASLLTGLYPHQAGMGDMVGDGPPGPYQGYLNDQCVTLGEVLKGAGYYTLMSGKWHVGEQPEWWPTKRGFDRYFGLISGAANYWDITKAKSEGKVRVMAEDGERYYPPKDGFYMTDAITDHATEYIDTYGKKENPFFLYVAYTAPHWPLHAPQEEIERFKGNYMAGWDALREERYARMLEMGIFRKKWSLSPRDEEVNPWETIENKEEMDLKMAVYAAQIAIMDRGIGKIMDALEKTGQTENTLVLFLADNGACHEGGPLGFDKRENGIPPGGPDSYMSYGRSWAMLGNTPFRKFKHWCEEGGIATPLIAHWPKVIQEGGSITHQRGHIIDFMATFCDITDATYPEKYGGNNIVPMEGKSLLPIFQGKTREGHDALYWEHEGNRAIYRDKWKLVGDNKEAWELYNMDEDRSETNNVIEEYPEVARDLRTDWQEWAKRCGVKT